MKIQELFEYKGLFILYMIISANFLAQTFSCSLQKVLNNNMYVKHIVGFLTLFFFITLTSTPTPTQNTNFDEKIFFKKIGMSILLYALFICSTRTNNVFFNIFITLLAANFLIKSYTDSLDPEKFKERIKKLNKIATYCGRLSIVILVIGLVLYYGEKK